jgi:general secretion pathway protein H
MRSQSNGFTILELMAAITIVAVILAVSVPSTVRFYDSLKYRGAVRDVISILGSARYSAVSRGRSQDVLFKPSANQVVFNDTVTVLPAGVNLVVHSAATLNRSDAGVIRFYPEGGSSGGGVDVELPGAYGVAISVDWLIGSVSQNRYGLD